MAEKRFEGETGGKEDRTFPGGCFIYSAIPPEVGEEMK